MKKVIVMLCLVLSLSACGNQTLVVREILEADQYLRQNASSMDWALFQQLLSRDTTVTKDDLANIKTILTESKESSFEKFDNVIYRFSKDRELVYVAEWKQENGLLKLYSLDYIEKRD